MSNPLTWQSQQYSTVKESIFYRWAIHLHDEAGSIAQLKNLYFTGEQPTYMVQWRKLCWGGWERIPHPGENPSTRMNEAGQTMFVTFQVRRHPSSLFYGFCGADPRDSGLPKGQVCHPGEISTTRMKRSWRSSRGTRNRRSRSSWVRHLPTPLASKFVILQVRYRPSLLSTTEVALNWKL